MIKMYLLIDEYLFLFFILNWLFSLLYDCDVDKSGLQDFL